MTEMLDDVALGVILEEAGVDAWLLAGVDEAALVAVTERVLVADDNGADAEELAAAEELAIAEDDPPELVEP